VQVVSDGTGEGGARVGYIDDGDWIMFEPYNLQGVTELSVRASSGGSGGTIEVRSGSPDGPLVSSVYVPNTGDWTNYVDLDPVPVEDPGGSDELYLTFSGGFDVDSFTFGRTDHDCETDVPADDEFDGTELDPCRWSVIRSDPSHRRLADGALEIDAVAGDMYAGTSDARNIVVQPAPTDTGWEAVTKVDVGGTDDFEQAGLMVLGQGSNFAKAVLINIPGQGWRMEFGQNIDGVAVFDESLDRSGPLPGSVTDDLWVRLASDGSTLRASWSADGESWNPFGRGRALNTLRDPKVGMAAFNGAGATARFDFFHLDEKPLVPCSPTQPGKGYASLFDGTRESLDGWTMAGPGGFAYADCELMSYGGLGLLWNDENPLRDYSLKLDWKMAGDDNSGVFVGFPDIGDDPWAAVDQGHEIQIDATDDPDSTTGAIYNAQAPDTEARDAALNPPGEWNAYEIVVEGDRIRVYLNDVLVNDYTDTDPARMNQPSYVGLQNHGNGDEVFFRNVRVKELTAPTIAVSGVEDGATYGDSESLTVDYSATDAESGVDEVTATLDGEPVASGATVDLYELDLGGHALTVTATDNAGNEATQTLTFTTTTSLEDIEALVATFHAQGAMDDRVEAHLTRAVRRAQRADASGQDRRLVAELDRFKADVERWVTDETAREVLIRDADAVLAETEGDGT